MLFRQTDPPVQLAPVSVAAPPGKFRRALLSVFLTVVVSILTAAVGMVVVNEVWRYISGLDDFKINPVAVKMQLPAWAKKPLAEEIRSAVTMRDEHSIFQPGLAVQIAREYEKSPWVTRVLSIRKEFPNRIIMRLCIRKPAALVRTTSGMYLVDREGVVLPETLYQWPETEGTLPVVSVGPDIYPCSPGCRWADKPVQAGVGLVNFLRSYGLIKELDIICVDVSNVGGRRQRRRCEIVLINKNGTQIKWGRFSAERRPGEVPNPVKLQNLLTAVKRRGKDLAGLEYVDVRWDDPYEKRRELAGR